MLLDGLQVLLFDGLLLDGLMMLSAGLLMLSDGLMVFLDGLHYVLIDPHVDAG